MWGSGFGINWCTSFLEMSGNIDIIEEYGFKAHSAGKFQEWRDVSSSIMEENPKFDTGEAAIKAYNKVMGSV